MSQYLNLVFSFIHFILISVLLCVSNCDNRSLEIMVFNNSMFEIIESLDTNSSIRYLNQNTSINGTFFDDQSSDGIQVNQCLSADDCEDRQKCCLINLSVKKKICIIDPFGFKKCKRGFGDSCEKDFDCEQYMELICEQNTCNCLYDYTYNTNLAKCVKSEYTNPNTAMQIYKITMIFASCCLALILIIFLICILRKSYCRPRRQVVPLDNSTIPDIFTLFPHVGNYDGGPLGDGTLPPFEKPPTYDETLTLIRNEIGIPPPAYRSGNTPNSSNPSTPDMSSRFLISNPTLLTVGNSTNNSSRTGSDSNLSSDVSLAGPSGSASCPQGIDNPAFC